ncbi:MAG: ATP-dependent sacrificial sulfur transferase LarE [Candidatus Methanoliparum thermophilum]|uniref:ATP-dependent sacrificial sulfur transferase LarE n=1 Tax=Methanoliparum thermophilum TaxID=2491083 RepID=A0A520KSS5_METT2|nr:ATP-dependent sacrificial sulfur transferase LarE [Candidatus Methanoliparum sp. LAM-1]RZN64966.1 MAG: ATP-dependent sacrificial sulfur transferase LarE [Candidatus Methanoliparum thermophilum]BDC36151.1 argininosuccinate synthase [Candidatus Methanoliparum sp. LAM-1]
MIIRADIIKNKLDRLEEEIRYRKKLLISFSGGVDSSLLAKVAKDVLGYSNVICVFFDSDLISRSEREMARAFLKKNLIDYRVEELPILNDENFIKNTIKRCYICKKVSSRLLKKIAIEKGIRHIADGVNLSDLNDYRPGVIASNEEGIWHPYLDVGINKEDIREISRMIGLPLWDKPSSACLASRIPFGEEIYKERISMIEEAEGFLKMLGFEDVRVRNPGKTARIEARNEYFSGIIRYKEVILKKFKSLGFEDVFLDLNSRKRS